MLLMVINFLLFQSQNTPVNIRSGPETKQIMLLYMVTLVTSWHK